jgi:uncharacterized protein (TIGR02266 family)
MGDRRRDLRAVVRLEVKPGTETLKRVPFYVASNISKSGMFIITTDPLPEKTEIKLQFQLPADSEKIQVIARVLWCREKDERPPHYPGMGLIFTEIKEADQDRIDRFVKEALEIQAEAEKPSV